MVGEVPFLVAVDAGSALLNLSLMLSCALSGGEPLTPSQFRGGHGGVCGRLIHDQIGGATVGAKNAGITGLACFADVYASPFQNRSSRMATQQRFPSKRARLGPRDRFRPHRLGVPRASHS